MDQIRILVVDDEAGLRTTLAANLELEDFTVVEAANGAEALDRLSSESFNMIISDMRMPEMNGLDLLREVKQRTPDVPIVLMTGFELEEMIDQAVNEGVFTILTKPFRIEDVLEIVRRATRSSVLVVTEKECDSRATAKATLDSAGVPTQMVVNRDEALELIGTGGTDVCLVELCGDSAAREMIGRIRERDASVSVIAVSPPLDSEAMNQMVATRPFALIEKPIEARLLLQTIVRARLPRSNA